MTSELAIKCFDPNFKKEYILILADTQSNIYRDEKFIPEENIKINKFLNTKDNRYLIAYSGNSLYNEKINPAIINENYRKITDEKNLSFGELENSLKNINSKLSEIDTPNTFLIANNLGKLSLDAYDINGLQKDELFFSAGNGSKEINKWIKQKLINLNRDENNFILPISDAIKLSMQALNYAAKSDINTGGYFNLGILSEDKKINFSEFGKINKNLGYREMIKLCEKEKNKVEQTFNVNSLEELIFN